MEARSGVRTRNLVFIELRKVLGWPVLVVLALRISCSGQWPVIGSLFRVSRYWLVVAARFLFPRAVGGLASAVIGGGENCMGTALICRGSSVSDIGTNSSTDWLVMMAVVLVAGFSGVLTRVVVVVWQSCFLLFVWFCCDPASNS